MLFALGRRKEGLRVLERAIKIEPKEPAWRYNYSLKMSDKAALEYLEQLDDDISEDLHIQLRIAILENKINHNNEPARFHVNQFKDFPELYDDFEKEILLPQVHKICGVYYSYSSETDLDDDAGKYLETK